jgi:hypothetical protein
MKNYIIPITLILLLSCTKKKAKPDLINHILESKIEGKKYYEGHEGIGFSTEGTVTYNNIWFFKKDRSFSLLLNDVISYEGAYSSVWSIESDSLFIDQQILFNKTSLFRYKIIEINDSLITLKQNYKVNIGTTNSPVYKDSAHYTYLKTTKWDFNN